MAESISINFVGREVGVQYHPEISEAAFQDEMIAREMALDAGQNVKFSFRVDDNADGGTMELSRERSVAKQNSRFRVDWTEHRANELEFGWGK